MPRPDTTGYLVLDLKVGDDDEPTRDPQATAARVAEALEGIAEVVETRPAFSCGDGSFRTYGEGVRLL